MRETPNRPPLRILTIVGLALALAAPQRANAQLMSKWGHPVFTIGSTPYDSTNAGHGNYPGGPGFIPGYGYYPGPGPDHYPWMDGPDTPFDRRQLWNTFPGQPPDAEAISPPADADPLQAGAALVVVQVPAEAQISFDEAQTSQGGSYRRFVTPPLPAGHELVYTIRARWWLKGVELSRVETVRVQPGGRVLVNFLRTDGWTGRSVTAPAAP
jgi:uncharacterized protein (TIGR03000 family)